MRDMLVKEKNIFEWLDFFFISVNMWQVVSCLLVRIKTEIQQNFQIPIQYGINFWLIAWRWHQVCFFDYLNIQDQSDPPYDFRDEGDNMLTTFFHLKTKEIDFNTPTKDARAQFNEPVPLSHRTC